MTAPESHTPDPPSEEGHSKKIRRVVGALAQEFAREGVSAGDRAALRRARPGDLGSPAFWKLALRRLEPEGLLPLAEGPSRDDQERRWVRIVADLAELRGLHSRARRHSLGRSLAVADLGEARVLRLLRAEDDALLRLARIVSHRLAVSRTPVDTGDLAELILSDGHPSWSANVRRRIARAYFQAEAASATDSTVSPEP